MSACTLLSVLGLFASPALAQSPAPRPDAGNIALVEAWGLSYGAYVGGTTGYLVGETLEVREEDHTWQGVVPGALVGGAAGVTAAALIAPRAELSGDEGAWLWTGTGLGIYAGAQLGRALIPHDAPASTERVHASALAGSMAGAGVSLLAPAPDTRAQLNFDLAVGIGSLAGAGLSDAADLYNPEDRQVRAGINLAGAVGFGAAGAAFHAYADEQPNAGAWGLALVHGSWIGAMTPYMFTDTPSDRQILGGMRAGLGLGYAGALLEAAAGNPDTKSVALQAVGTAAGGALGAGIPMATRTITRPRQVVTPMVLGEVSGQVLGAVVAPHYELSEEDAFLLATLAGWTGYQAAGWTAWSIATTDEPTRALGVALTAGGSGTLLAMGIAPAIDVPASGSAMLLSAGGWGTWYGGWSAKLLGYDADAGWTMMLTAGDVALAGTAIAEGIGYVPTWRQVALLDGMGLLGAAGGGLIGVIGLYREDDWRPMIGAIMAGSTIGLGAGIAMSAHPPERARKARGMPTLNLGRSGWTPRVAARPWMDEQGDPGMWAEVSLIETGRDHARR